MYKFAKIAVLTVAVLAVASPAWAADETPADEATVTAAGAEEFAVYLGLAFGVGMIVVGSAYAVGKIGSAAVENMARQPEVARNIQTAMLISAALIEGFTFFGLAVWMLKVLR